jgi:ureidoglycolate lyase
MVPRLPVEELTPDAFAPYGRVIEQPGMAADASGSGWSWWGETQLLAHFDRPYAVGYLDLEPGGLEFDWAERHLKSIEVIIPLGGVCLVYVGSPGDAPDWDRFRVFRLCSGQAVVLNEGVWHGAPLALDHALQALVLLRQGTGAEDVEKLDRDTGSVKIVRDLVKESEGEITHASR